MKIKCPVCGEVKIMKHAFEYHKLLFKIHEILEDCNKDIWGAYNKSWVIKQFESLLENEKL